MTTFTDSPQDVDPEGHGFDPLRVSVSVIDGTPAWDDMMIDLGILPLDVYDDVAGYDLTCECDRDWNCGCGRAYVAYDPDHDFDPPMPYWAEVRESMGVGW